MKKTMIGMTSPPHGTAGDNSNWSNHAYSTTSAKCAQLHGNHHPNLGGGAGK